MRNRTWASLVVKDATTNQDETLYLIFPVTSDQTALLDALVANFCAEKNLNLVPAPSNPDFMAWPDRVRFDEFQCEVCGQSYVDPSANLVSADTAGRFCCNFCRNSSHNESKAE